MLLAAGGTRPHQRIPRPRWNPKAIPGRSMHLCNKPVPAAKAAPAFLSRRRPPSPLAPDRWAGALPPLIDSSAESACSGSRAACAALAAPGPPRLCGRRFAPSSVERPRAASPPRRLFPRTGVGRGSDVSRRTPIPSTRPFSRPSGRHQDRSAFLRNGLWPALTPTGHPYEPAATRAWADVIVLTTSCDRTG